MTAGTRSPWHVERIDQTIVDRLAARHTPDPLRRRSSRMWSAWRPTG
jgi:hypothetical protein